jgi:hypothetical protein
VFYGRVLCVRCLSCVFGLLFFCWCVFKDVLCVGCSFLFLVFVYIVSMVLLIVLDYFLMCVVV